MSDKLKEAIEKLKWLSEQISPSPIKEAIDTVLKEVEKPLLTDVELALEISKLICDCGIPSPDSDRECCMICGKLIHDESQPDC